MRLLLSTLPLFSTLTLSQSSLKIRTSQSFSNNLYSLWHGRPTRRYWCLMTVTKVNCGPVHSIFFPVIILWHNANDRELVKKKIRKGALILNHPLPVTGYGIFLHRLSFTLTVLTVMLTELIWFFLRLIVLYCIFIDIRVGRSESVYS